MGKWATCTFPEGFDEREKELKDMTFHAINDLWMFYGSLSLGDFANMRWYWSQTNGWACIDNCEGKNAPAMMKVFCSYADYVNDEKRINFEKMCICLAVEFNAPREMSALRAAALDAPDKIVDIEVMLQVKPITKPIGYNLNILVKGDSARPSLQLHLFNGRYDPVVAFLCADEEHAQCIIDAFTSGDQNNADVTKYFNSAPWFPIVYAENAIAAIEAMLDHTNQPFVEKDILRWAKAVERAAGAYLYVDNVKELPADLDEYMKGW